MSTVVLQKTFRLRKHDVTIGLPEVSRARLITTSVLASSASVLWLGSAGLLPFAELDAKVATAGLLPYGVGWVTLLLAERRAKRDLRRARAQDYGSAVAEEVAGR